MSDPAIANTTPEAVPEQRLRPKKPPGVQPTFRVLIGLTLVTALLLAPYAFSAIYLDELRANSVELHQFLRGELYKQTTGYVALLFVLFELALTARKRSRSWPLQLKLPGSMLFWRSLHIFLGVGLVAAVLVHTLGSNGLNLNSVLLWTFFGATLSALVGVVAESGVLESPRRVFGRLPGGAALTKGPLIRSMRAVWLSSHIFLVSVFGVLLLVHIFLAYYYQ